MTIYNYMTITTIAQFTIKGNRGKLFISFESVEVNVHKETRQVEHIFSCRYVCILDIMGDSDNKTQNCTFQFVKW